jgi:uncharacterized protein
VKRAASALVIGGAAGACACWLWAAAPISAQDLPALAGPVNDFARVIDQSTSTEIDRRIRALQSASGDAVVVLTVDRIAPYGSIEAYAVALFERAGIGSRPRDNGVLIVVATADRLVRIEVGYGLEEFVTDGYAGETIRREMLPAFREGRYGDGVLAGTTRIVQRIADGRGVTLANVPDSTRDEPDGPPVAAIIVLLVAFMLASGFLRRGGGGPFVRRRQGPSPGWGGWSSGPGGFGGHFGGGFGGRGGFGGFGGGRSGGGGASGRW